MTLFAIQGMSRLSFEVVAFVLSFYLLHPVSLVLIFLVRFDTSRCLWRRCRVAANSCYSFIPILAQLVDGCLRRIEPGSPIATLKPPGRNPQTHGVACGTGPHSGGQGLAMPSIPVPRAALLSKTDLPGTALPSTGVGRVLTDREYPLASTHRPRTP